MVSIMENLKEIKVMINKDKISAYSDIPFIKIGRKKINILKIGDM